MHVFQWPIAYFITFATCEIAHSNSMFERMSQSLIKTRNKVDCVENMWVTANANVMGF